MPEKLGLKISGKVQGVFYRAFVSREANRLGLTGYVMNMPDGSVDVVAEGEHEKLTRFVQLCRHGPPAARIDKVVEDWQQSESKHKDFRIKQYD